MPELSSQQESSSNQGESLRHLDYLREEKESVKSHLEYIKEMTESWEQMLQELEDGTLQVGSEEELEKQKARVREAIERSREEEAEEEARLEGLNKGENAA